MICPNCRAQMWPGTLSLESSTTGAVLEVVDVVLTGRKRSSLPLNLYFRRAGNGEAVRVGYSGRAHRCPKCQTVVLTPSAQLKESDATEAVQCLSCGRTIPAGSPKCSACGWSWEGSAEEDG